MAAPYFYLSDGVNTLNLDDNVKEITFGGSKRAFDVIEYATANGGFLRGIGNYQPKIFKLVHVEKIETGDVNFWNSRRNDFIVFFTKAVYNQVYLYLQNGEQTMTVRTQVFCTKIPEDKFDFLHISKSREFELISPTGYWEKTTATTGSESITSSAEQTITLTNNSTIEIAPTFTFTPTNFCSHIQLKTSEGFLIRVEGDFEASIPVAINMNNGEMTIDGDVVDLSNYLTQGSPFLIPNGANSIYVKCSTAGTLAYSYYERYI